MPTGREIGCWSEGSGGNIFGKLEVCSLEGMIGRFVDERKHPLIPRLVSFNDDNCCVSAYLLNRRYAETSL
jgi:hypothetical protein